MRITHDFECTICHKTYANKYNLNRHITALHPVELNNQDFNKSRIKIADALNDDTSISYDNSKINNYIESGTQHNNEEIIPPKIVYLHQGGNDAAKNTSNFECNYCHTNFTRKDSLKKHIQNRCKVKKQQDQEKDKIFQQMIEYMEKQDAQMKEQQEKIKQLEEQINNNNGDINSHNMVNSNNTVCSNSQKSQLELSIKN